LFGGTDFSYLKVTLGSGANAPVLTYGNFITAVINFLITSLIIFGLIKAINKAVDKASALRKKEDEEVLPTEKECPYCYSKINIKATRCPHCTSELK
jgi:large conductance mechanosensitive channel